MDARPSPFGMCGDIKFFKYANFLLYSTVKVAVISTVISSCMGATDH